jgi:hypothetical protein
MKGWLDNYGKADNANDSNVSVSKDFVGLGYNTKGRNYSPAWGGQFQDGGQLIPVSPMQQITGQASSVSPTVPYLQTKDPVEFYKSWIQSPEYARRQLLTGYSPSAEDESISVPSAAASRQIRLESLQNIDPITYSTRQPSESRPGVYGIPSTVNINPLDYIDTNRGMVEAHELAHIAGAMESEGTTRPGVMSAKEQEIFKKSMLPMKEPVLSGPQGSQQREASKRALEDFEHSKKPKELKADLDALRFTMYDKGIYDITKGQKFTESDFEKAKQSLGKDRVFKRLENRVGKKNFVNLMNTIAKADEEELPLAMGGMSIPGSVGFTYARTAGSAPSKGKYAKKTMASAQNGIMSPLLLGRKILEYIYPSEEAVNTVEAAPANYKKGLTNELLQRQAYKESTFNPAAVSPAGYKGLTQIGEGVIEDYSKKKGGKKLDPFNPKDAVELQKFAMDDLYNASFINKPEQSDSVRIAKTLAAYNWGRGNLANYLNEQKSKGVDIYGSYDWLNNLPKETSDYVNKILLQEDPSFNKNYKKASTNPKYEEVTSLYDQKKFGGNIPSAQKGKNDIEKISINDPRYPELYKNRQVGLSYDGTISLPDLDEVTVTAPRSYTMDSLRDFTTAALYGAPATAMKLEQIPTAALAETAAMLTGKPYNFSNINPNLGQFGSNQRDLSILGYENPQGFLQNAANTALSVIDPALIAGGASMLRKPVQQALKSTGKLLKTENPLEVVSKINSKNLSPTSWSMQEAPGLHLKSTMSDGPISKIVEPKTGLVNIEQAFAIIGKESGGPDKVALIKQGIGENIPKKMDFNEFRKTVQDQLIPLERQFTTGRSDYGLGMLGYNTPTRGGFNNRYVIKEAEAPIENQTLILGNKGRFGRGSSAHNNPDETLGHIHFLRDAETPDVLTVTQIQSDAFQGTHRIMPKGPIDISKYQKSLERMQKINETNQSILNKMKNEGLDEAGFPVQESQIKQFEDIVKKQESQSVMGKAELENFTQKSLLDKNHQERYLQELVDYGAKRGDVNKVRLPTSETAAKVQGYQPVTTSEELLEKHNKLKGTKEWDNVMANTPDADKVRFEKVLEGKIKGDIYDLESETILKKYAEQPKTIKKLFGVEPKIVTDSKGNSWYEFDIPKSFKEGKGEIKAFKNGGKLNTAQNGQEMKFYQNGLDWKPKSMQDGGEESFGKKATKFVSEKISGPVTEKALELLNMVKPISNPEIYKTVRPVGYPNALQLPMHAYNYLMGNESEPLKTKSGKPHLAEEFWATAMGMPVERQYLKESKYKPSVAKDPDAKYYTIRDIIDDYDLMNLTKDLKPGEKMEMNGLLPILDSKWYSENADTDKNVKFGDVDPLQRFTLQKSPDGSYVSIYDKYDFNNPALNKRMNPIEIYDRFYLPKKRKGGVIKDNRGQWAHPGEVTEIDSNYITMEGVPYDVIGVSDAGDTKLMKPGKNYKFKGKKVTEYPVAELGINQLDAQPMKKLNQLLNFTNNPDKDNWLDKYN